MSASLADGVRGDEVSAATVAAAAAAFAAAAQPVGYHTVHGNHDVGYSHALRQHPEALDRHEAGGNVTPTQPFQPEFLVGP